MGFTVHCVRDRAEVVAVLDRECGCNPWARYQRGTNEAGHEHWSRAASYHPVFLAYQKWCVAQRHAEVPQHDFYWPPDHTGWRRKVR